MGNAVMIKCGLTKVPKMLITVVKAVVPPFLVVSIVSIYCGTFHDGCFIDRVLRNVRTNINTIVTSIACRVKTNVIRSGGNVSAIVVINTFVTSYVFRMGMICIIVIYKLVKMVQAYVTGEEGGG